MPVNHSINSSPYSRWTLDSQCSPRTRRSDYTKSLRKASSSDDLKVTGMSHNPMTRHSLPQTTTEHAQHSAPLQPESLSEDHALKLSQTYLQAPPPGKEESDASQSRVTRTTHKLLPLSSTSIRKAGQSTSSAQDSDPTETAMMTGNWEQPLQSCTTTDENGNM